MVRKIVCVMLMVGLVLSMYICTSVLAEPVASGKFGRSNLEMEWSVEGNTLYITGNGYMDGFSMTRTRPWDPYRGQIQRVVMNGNIENIGYYAFEGCTELTEIVWPNGLKYIHDNAFRDCTSLKEVTIPEQVEILYKYVFYGCTALETVTLPQSVLKLGEGAFYKCTSLHTVTLPPKLWQIGRKCFEECKALKQIQLPEMLAELGAAAFADSGLVEIDIPEQVYELSQGVFSFCMDLKTVNILGENLQKVDRDAFRQCEALKTLHLPASVTSFQMSAFMESRNLEGVYFHGDMPEIITVVGGPWLSLTVYYPEGNSTWTQEKMDAYIEDTSWELRFVSTVYPEPEEPAAEPTVQPATDPLVTQPAAETTGPVAPEPTQETGSATACTTTPVPTETTDTLQDNASDKMKNWYVIIPVVVIMVALGAGGGVYIYNMLWKKKK